MTPKITSVLPVRQYGRLKAPSVQQGLLSLRLDSYREFLERGIAQSLGEMAEISSDTARCYSIRLDAPLLQPPERSAAECVERGLTYDSPLTVMAMLTDLDSGEIAEQRVNGGAISNRL